MGWTRHQFVGHLMNLCPIKCKRVFKISDKKHKIALIEISPPMPSGIQLQALNARPEQALEAKEKGNEWYRKTKHDEQDKSCLDSPPQVVMTSPTKVEIENSSNILQPADEQRFEDYCDPPEGHIRDQSVEGKAEMHHEESEDSNQYNITVLTNLLQTRLHMVPNQEEILNTKTRAIVIPTSNWLDNQWICTQSDKEVGFFPPNAFRWKKSKRRGKNGLTPYPVSEKYPFMLKGQQVELCWSDSTSFLSRRHRHGYSSRIPTEDKVPVQIVEPTVKKTQDKEHNWPATDTFELSKQRKQRPVPLKRRVSHKLESNLLTSQSKGVDQNDPLKDSTVATSRIYNPHPATKTQLLSQDHTRTRDLSPGFIKVSEV